MKHVIVTGANGFIGSNVTRYLLLKGIEVTAIVHHSTERIDSLKVKFDGNLRIVVCDMENIASLPELLKGKEYDVFYHFAWNGSAGALRADYITQAKNAIASAEAVKTAKILGCRRFVSVGTITEHIADDLLACHYTSENLIYGLSKDYAHKLVDITAHKEKIPYVWGVLSNIYGGDNETGNLISYTLNQFKCGKKPTYGPCLQPYNFTHIDDVVEALFLLGVADKLEKEEYLVSNGECRSLREYLEELASICCKEVAIGERSDDGVRYDASWFSDNGLQSELGFKPKYDFSNGINKLMNEMEK